MLDADYSFVQIEEKFGTLRAYVEVEPTVEDQADVIVREAEGRSAVTCEGSGAPVALRRDRQWSPTLCDL